MGAAIFDLDNTLLGGDSDFLWGQFLTEKGVVEKDFYEQENKRFYDAYKAGTLDIYEFLRFSLAPLKEHDFAQLQHWRRIFIEEKIKPIVLPKAQALVEEHQNRGDVCMIITATNSFVTQPIAELYGIDILLATEPEFINGQYTGEVFGVPCFKEGKVENLQHWMQKHQKNLSGSYFYSDSHNDLPLLKMVDHPVVVDADDILQNTAKDLGWKQLSLR